MSFSWEDRHNHPLGAPAYGGSGAIDLSLIYNDPRFAETVQDAVRRVATMQGAFPHGSIDPRALRDVPTLDTLPVRHNVYPGMVIRYRFAHDDIARQMWWDPAANSGDGAWIVVGGGALAAAAEGSNFTTSTSYSTMTNGPTISLPFGGLWEFEWTARMESNNAANAVRAAVSGPGFSGEGGNTVFGSTLSVPCSGLTGPIAVSGSGTAALQFLTDNGSFTCTALQRRLRARPVELRPY